MLIVDADRGARAALAGVYGVTMGIERAAGLDPRVESRDQQTRVGGADVDKQEVAGGERVELEIEAARRRDVEELPEINVVVGIRGIGVFERDKGDVFNIGAKIIAS